MAENHLKKECPECMNLVFQSELDGFGGWCMDCYDEVNNEKL